MGLEVAVSRSLKNQVERRIQLYEPFYVADSDLPTNHTKQGLLRLKRDTPWYQPVWQNEASYRHWDQVCVSSTEVGNGKRPLDDVTLREG